MHSTNDKVVDNFFASSSNSCVYQSDFVIDKCFGNVFQYTGSVYGLDFYLSSIVIIHLFKADNSG